MSRCFFIGHRDAPQAIYNSLVNAIEQQIAEYGVTEFIVGHYGNFDRMAAQAVAVVKERHRQVKLTLLIPYHPTEQSVSISSAIDAVWYPSLMEQVPRRLAILRANRYAVDYADRFIVYVRQVGKFSSHFICTTPINSETNRPSVEGAVGCAFNR